MLLQLMQLSVLMACGALSSGHPDHPRVELDGESPPRFISREDWGARPPAGPPAPLRTPVQYVVVHHTYIPDVCLTEEQCTQAMRDMQDHHQHGNGWMDIGYNFAVGGEGGVYEGRGWLAVGAHAAGTNSVSIGIAIIGNYTVSLPPRSALQTTRQLIAAGVRRAAIRPDYRLIGHRQATATECPGDALYREIQTWDHFYTSTEPLPLSLLGMLSGIDDQ